MKLAETSRFLYNVKITQMTSATTTKRELWREFGSKRAWTPQSSFPVRRLRLIFNRCLSSLIFIDKLLSGGLMLVGRGDHKTQKGRVAV